MDFSIETVIIGGGMIGRIAQRYIPDALILDWNKAPSRNTAPPQLGANYLWEPVADILCRRLSVRTTIDGAPATFDSIVSYKHRVGKADEVQTRWQAVSRQFQEESWGYVVSEFPPPTRIQYDAHVVSIDVIRSIIYLKNGDRIKYTYLVSTIPLPALIKMSRDLIDIYGKIGFPSSPIFVHVMRDDTALAQDIHVDYRTSGDCYRSTRHADGARHDEYLGPVPNLPTKKIVPGRIYDVPESPHLLKEMQQAFNIHCFGRYARWESDELTHMSDALIRAWVAEKV